MTLDELKSELHYDPLYGDFVRKKDGSQADKNDYTKGYKRVFVLGKRYKAHRLAWFYMTGKWPQNQIDHINGVKNDNRWSNLRDVCQTLNVLNQHKAHKQSKTGVLGVSTSYGQFIARLTNKGKLLYGGTFTTVEEASQKYNEMKQEYAKKVQQ